MNEWYYLLILVSAVSIPLVVSFWRPLGFRPKIKISLVAIGLSAPVFIVWDILFTRLGVWGFNPSYYIGPTLLGLPVEELLFFFFIPFCCLFTYHCLRSSSKRPGGVAARTIVAALGVFCVILAVCFTRARYTFIASALLSIVCFISTWKNPPFLGHFLYSYVILLIPFLLVNGALTGVFTPAPVVWYHHGDITGLRILTIPVEDLLYSALLIFCNAAVFERLTMSEKLPANDRFAQDPV